MPDHVTIDRVRLRDAIAREALQIAASICVYTNTEIVVESLGP